MRNTVALIGSGNLGIRHLEALIKSRNALYIVIVDPSPQALSNAKKITENTEHSHHTYKFETDLSSLSMDIDIAILATNADVRYILAKTLLSKNNVRYIVFEKVVFQNLTDFGDIAELLEKKKVISWVNCPRRLMGHYQNLKRNISNQSPYFAVFQGGLWGMACNSIHILDVFSYFTGSKEFHLTHCDLDKDLIESKRKGFFEVTGTMVFRDKLIGNTLVLHSQNSASFKTIFSLQTKEKQFLIDETRGILQESTDQTNSEWISHHFTMPFQSELTHFVVEEILNSGACLLTPFADSHLLHAPILNGLIQHFSSVFGKKIDHCPIT